MTLLSKTLSAIGQDLTGTATPDVQVYRKTVCMGCPTAVNTPGVGLTCGTYLSPQKDISCGCDILEKIKVFGERCPQGKW